MIVCSSIILDMYFLNYNTKRHYQIELKSDIQISSKRSMVSIISSV